MIIEGEGRTPHGVRGLKFRCRAKYVAYGGSHPSRGAWIEIPTATVTQTGTGASHPSRGAWIEICTYSCRKKGVFVAPLTGCVD